MAVPGGGKRKEGPNQGNHGRNSKRFKIHDARVIRSQTNDEAFNNGELNVEKFVKAREFEIRALEDGIKRSRHGLSTRAHQELPKELRRRTASHNAKRVPKRLRDRAKQEMIEDNTPTVTSRRRKLSAHQRLRSETAQRLQLLSKKSKARRQEKKAEKRDSEIQVLPGNRAETSSTQKATPVFQPKKRKAKVAKLREPPLPPAKFRKRQIQKTWLPTHLWHSKRAKMTAPKEPMWRFALPLTPAIKSYRNAHRAHADRGAIAWDMSYMSTIGLDGAESSIIGLMKSLGVGNTSFSSNPWGKTGAMWRAGTRALETWLHERDVPDVLIAPVCILWNPGSSSADTQPASNSRRKAFIRVHPSAFFQLWEQVTRLAKVQKPSVTVEDLRFELGSIEITGPDASEVLVGILRVVGDSSKESFLSEHERTWTKLALCPPTSAPQSAVLTIKISDPRLQHPPRTLALPDSEKYVADAMELVTNWSPDKVREPAKIFDRNARLKACRSLPSQTSINRRKGLANPGEYPKPLPTDPEIPVTIIASRSGLSGSGTWIVILPFQCVLPVWKSLVYYPLSTGGTIRFGGVQEKRQLAYERSTPWFPADFPGTKAGVQWEMGDSIRRKTEWDRKPKGRRLEYDSIVLGGGRKGELGNGWSCDWQRLVQGPPQNDDTLMAGAEHNEHSSSSKHSVQILQQPLHQLPSALSHKILRQSTDVHLPVNALANVKVTMVSKGRPSTCARIYRLPAACPDLYSRWLDQLATANSARSSYTKANLTAKPKVHSLSTNQKVWLAQVAQMELPGVGSEDYPTVPEEDDLIGFITAGNFNLVEGRGVGIGSVLFHKVMPKEGDWYVSTKDKNTLRKEFFLCVVRDAGETHGRLAQWELV